jgi:hypothetical protein
VSNAIPPANQEAGAIQRTLDALKEQVEVLTGQRGSSSSTVEQDRLNARDAFASLGGKVRGKVSISAPNKQVLFRLMPGDTPASNLEDGDLWTTSTRLNVRLDGVTKELMLQDGGQNLNTSGTVTGADGIPWRYEYTGAALTSNIRNIVFRDCRFGSTGPLGYSIRARKIRAEGP